MLMKKTKNNKKVKILLIEKDLNVSKLSKMIGRSRTWTSLVLYGNKKSIPTRKAIARVLGVPYEELWGEKE